jgi:hypothetical protein
VPVYAEPFQDGRHVAFVINQSTSHVFTKMASASAAAASSALVTAGAAASKSNLPPPGVLLRAAQIALDDDRPILLDYWVDSCDKKCCIGVKETLKYLVKSETEYTSTIQNLFKIQGCYIVLTENSLYIVSVDTPIRKIVTPIES